MNSKFGGGRTVVAILVVALLFVSALIGAQVLADSTITVNTTADENNTGAGCSLREAITAANTNAAYGGCTTGTGADTITVPAGTYTLTLAGAGEDANATGDLDIAGDVTINGAGANNTIIQAGTLGYPDGSANGIDRVMHILSVYVVRVTGVTIANGKCVSCHGGGIYSFFGTLRVTNVTLSGNSASEGGGIDSYGTLIVDQSTFADNLAQNAGGGIGNNTALTVTNSTFSNNTTENAGAGGGIANYSVLTLTNSTLSGNSAPGGSGGGIYNFGTLNLRNTILANSPGGGDCYNSSGDTIGSNTNNLIETNSASGNMCGVPAVTGDPHLGALAENGGSTKTFALLTGSPAMDAGDNTVCAAAPVGNQDQRGVTRPVDGDGNGSAICDMGAYEAPQGSTPTPTSSATQTPTQTSLPTQTPTATPTTSCIAKPGKPTLLKPKNGGNVTKSKVPLDWSDVTCTTKYKVVVKVFATGTTAFKQTIKSPLVSRTKTTTLLPKKYQWFVKACNAFGCNKSVKFTFTN